MAHTGQDQLQSFDTPMLSLKKIVTANTENFGDFAV